MQDDLLTDAIDRLLSEVATPDTVRSIERGGPSAELWAAIEASGFCDALVGSRDGGAGLDLAAVFPVVEACGRHVLAVPLAQTMMARALLAKAGRPVPAGSIALATCPANASGPVMATVLYGAVADQVLVQQGERWAVLDAARASYRATLPSSVDAEIHWSQDAFSHAASPLADVHLRSVEAALLAAQMAGAQKQVLAMTLRYAGERVQFGKPIGSFQAVQHQISVMAEHVAAARMAARMAFAAGSTVPDVMTSALAKARCSAAAAIVGAAAHAVHGAIGITQEYGLQLLTRRLHSWRQAAGSASYWQTCIGRALVSGSRANALDFARLDLSPAPCAAATPPEVSA